MADKKKHSRDLFDHVFFYNSNPTPGILINHPNGSDVYQGVPKDYIEKVSS